VAHWSRNIKRYRFFSAFVDGLLFAAYYAMVEQNEPIDKNTQADVEVLMYMPDVDILVSNDRRFLKSTFDTFWRPKGKILFSTEEFVDWSSRL